MSFVKIVFGSQTRKYKMENQPNEDSYHHLVTAIHNLYGVPSEGSVALKYLDEENEYITISSHAELQEALRVAEQQGGKTLKLFINEYQSGSNNASLTSSPVPTPVSQVTEATIPVASESSEDDFVNIVEEEKKIADEAPVVENDEAAEEEPLLPVPLSDSAIFQSSSVQAQEYTDLPMVTRSSPSQQAQSNPEMPIIEDAPLEDDAVAPEPEEKKVPEPEEKEFPKREEIVPLVIDFFHSAEVLETIRTSLPTVQEGIRSGSSLEEMVNYVLSQPVINNHPLIQRLLPFLPLIISKAQTICDWNRATCAHFAGLASALLQENSMNVEKVDFGSIIDMIQQAIRQSAFLELDMFITPPSSNQETTQDRPVHSRITCDGCRMHPLVGIRYKCTICDDYDLCEGCEAKNVHPLSHPLVKIYLGDTRNNGKSIHDGVTCDMCQVGPIEGIRYKCTRCPNYDLCESCEAKNEHPNDHVLMKIRVPINHGAGGRCRFAPFRGFGLFRRQRCHPLRADFVAHKTVADGTHCAPNAVISKTWTVKNAGERVWPQGARLVYESGDILPVDGVQAFVVIPQAASNEQVDVTIALRAPSNPGRFVSTFHFETPTGHKFGHQLNVEINVMAQAPVQPSAPVQLSFPSAPVVPPQPQPQPVQQPVQQPRPQPPVVSFQFAAELGTLVSMGFDVERSKQALIRCRGSINEAVASMI